MIHQRKVSFSVLKVFYSLLFIAITSPCISQNDSIIAQLKNFNPQTLADTTWLNRAHHAIRARKNAPKDLEDIANEALIVAKQNKTSALIARAYSDLCFHFIINQNPNKFYEYIDEATEYCKINQNFKELAELYTNKARFHQRFGPQSLLPELSEKIVELGKKLDDYKTIFYGYYLMGALNQSSGDAQKGIEFYQLAQQTALDNEDWSRYYWILEGLTLAEINQGNYEKAIVLSRERMDYYHKNGRKIPAAKTQQHLVTIFLKMTPPQLDSALFYYNKVVPYYDSIQYNLGLGSTYFELGQYYLSKENNQKKSEFFLLKSLKFSKLGNYHEINKESAKLLSDLYEEKKDFEKAFFYYKEYDYWRDSINRSSVRNELEKQEIQSTYALNKSENEKLSLENKIIRTERRWLGITFFLALLVILALLYAYRKMQAAKKGLEILNGLQTNFFINATHEFMTPLTLISGLTKQILKRKEIDSSHQKKLKVIESNSHHLIDLASEMLISIKLEHTKPALEESSFELYDFLISLVDSFENMAKERAVDFTFNYAIKHPLYIKTDNYKLKKILYNLLSNAFKFSSKNDTISLSVMEVNGQIAIEVKDTGEGISAEDLPFIFNRFYQTQNKEKLQKGGTGIGLTICKEYAQLLKGSLEVESKIGEGSKFTFLFPKTEVDKIEVIQKDNSSIQENTDGDKHEPLVATSFYKKNLKSKVLIVEDNLDMQEYIHSILASEYYCIKASNGEEAIQLLQELGENLPELIISDIMMPILDGYEFSQILKATNAWCNIPLIFLTARNTQLDRNIAYTIGINDYISKPFDEDLLLAAVHNLLDKESFEEEAGSSNANYEEQSLVTSKDLEWIRKVEALIVKELNNPQLSVTFIADAVQLSERQFRRKIKIIVGMSPVNYFNEIKLQTARTLIEEGNYPDIATISKLVGFSSPAYFSKKFETRFGKPPETF